MANARRSDDPRMRIVVWFDRPRDCLCIADRDDGRCKEGEAIPDEAVIRVRLVEGEDFIEALFAGIRPEADFNGIIEGAQRALDMRAAQLVTAAERLRSEWRKRMGDPLYRPYEVAEVNIGELERLRRLRDEAAKLVSGRDAGRASSRLMDDFTLAVDEGKLLEP